MRFLGHCYWRVACLLATQKIQHWVYRRSLSPPTIPSRRRKSPSAKSSSWIGAYRSITPCRARCATCRNKHLRRTNSRRPSALKARACDVTRRLCSTSRCTIAFNAMAQNYHSKHKSGGHCSRATKWRMARSMRSLRASNRCRIIKDYSRKLSLEKALVKSPLARRGRIPVTLWSR